MKPAKENHFKLIARKHQQYYGEQSTVQRYANEQVNRVLDEAIQRVNNLKSLENFALSEALYDQCLNVLESLKIKQP